MSDIGAPGEGLNGVVSVLEDDTRKLRQRWELASVLNFLSVFKPVIGSDLKLSAEEIETGLIEANGLLAKLHIALLKGIPPSSKNLSTPDAWVTVLCKKLAMWWPWVAEGDIPLKAAKGEEILRYKKLDPTVRLLMLKALCEVRAEQADAVSYINDALKQGTQLSCFRKDKIGGEKNGICYWYDGNTVIGHRLYKEVHRTRSNSKHRGKECLNPATANWETLATNLNQFRQLLDEFSSRKDGAEVAVCRTIETDAIPELEKLQKKKERALKREQRQQSLLNGYRSYVDGVTRSCRTRRPVNYTFDEYDRTINQAIQLTKKRKASEEQSHDTKHGDYRKTSNGSSDTNLARRSLNPKDDETDHEDDDYNGNTIKNKNEKHSDSDMSDFDIKDNNNHIVVPLMTGTRNDLITRSPGLKNRLRQRPTRNTAIEPAVAPDSDSSGSSSSRGAQGKGSCEIAPDSEDETS